MKKMKSVKISPSDELFLYNLLSLYFVEPVGKTKEYEEFVKKNKFKVFKLFPALSKIKDLKVFYTDLCVKYVV